MLYLPLRVSETRLLKLLPKNANGATTRESSTTTDLIICTLSHVSLDERPDFEALSYVWGDEQSSSNILVDNESFSVRDNLFHALQDLRLDEQPRILWIDAVCINQDDQVEREEQVAQMRQIYEIATSVTIYLGQSWPSLDLATEFFESAATHQSYHYEPSLNPHHVIQGHDANSEALRWNLIRFLELPWWKRLWTAQEYILAQQLTFQCGNIILAGNVVQAAYENLRRHERTCCWNSPAVAKDASFGMTLLDSFLRMDATEKARNISGGHYPVPENPDFITFSQSLMESRQRHGRGNDELMAATSTKTSRALPHTFLTALDTFRSRESTDPRDKIYGLTGLHYRDNVAERFVKPDYSLDAEELYKTLVYTTINETKQLDIVSRASGYCEPALSLPSFVPDWTVSLEVSSNRNALLCDLYRAAASRPADWARIDSKTARSTALLLDSLGSFGRTQEPETDLSHALGSWAQIAGLNGNLTDDWGNLTGIFSKSSPFWRAISGDMVNFQYNGEPMYGLISREDLAADAESCQHAAFLKWYAYITGEPAAENDAAVAGFQSSFDMMNTGKKFAVTEQGRIGMVSNKSQDGDIVAVLSGGKVPFILRETQGGRYEIVGESYIHGIMMGEMINESAKWTTIEIV